jgi:hypothetical protein
MNTDSFHIPLVASAVAFAAFTIWRLRPSFLDRDEARVPDFLLREFQARIEAAASGEEKARALCDAGDACGQRTLLLRGAVGFYLRAMRETPASIEIVDRTATGLVRRPRALESLLWRRLGAEPWSGPTRASAKRVASHLARLYAGPLRNSLRARAMERAVESLID